MHAPATKHTIEQRNFVQSIERGFAIIQAFGAGRTTLTISEAAQITGLTRAAARRFLLTLAHLGYVGTDGKFFWLKPRVLELGHCYLTAQPWWRIAQPVVEDAARQTGESCSLCVLDGDEIVYVCRVAVHRIVSTNVSIGSRLPAYTTALGRVLLGQLPARELEQSISDAAIQKYTTQTTTNRKRLKKIIEQTNHDGYSLVNQELETGLIGLAVPITAPHGVSAALGVSVHAARVPAEEALLRYLHILKKSAEQILAGMQWPDRNFGRG